MRFNYHIYHILGAETEGDMGRTASCVRCWIISLFVESPREHRSRHGVREDSHSQMGVAWVNHQCTGSYSK